MLLALGLDLQRVPHAPVGNRRQGFLRHSGSRAVAAHLRERGLRLPPWCRQPMTRTALAALNGAHSRTFVSVLVG